MTIPLSYNLRNLWERRTTTAMTALGVGLTVAVLLSVLALVQGLKQTLRASGHPLNLVVLRKGAATEIVSNFPRATFQELKFRSGIARTAQGEPQASLEVVLVITLENRANPDGVNVNVRGLTQSGIQLREGLSIVQGRWFSPGQREVVVGRNLAERYPGARIGSKIELGRGDWEVVGVMDSGESAVNSEMWVDVNQVSAENNRLEVLSSCLVRATDEVAAQALINNLVADQSLEVDVLPEKEYFARQSTSSAPVQYAGILLAVIMSVGSAFAAMNTMYAAVARRSKEIGTLRILGFSQGEILLSFFTEALLLSLLGGLIGCLLVLPLNNINTGIGSFQTFNETSFRIKVTLPILLSGLGFSLVMGLLGGLFPARNAAKKEILVALKAT